MAILSGAMIHKAVKAGDIEIDPFEEKLLNPASIDLRLGNKVAVYTNWVGVKADMQDSIAWDVRGLEPKVYAGEQVWNGELLKVWPGSVSVKDKPKVATFIIDHEQGWLLKPGILYLMHTVESVRSYTYNPVLDGKSSCARLGIMAHITAGFGDLGYQGQYTLEVLAAHPIIVFPGMRFCQMRFHEICHDEEAPPPDYQKSGNYTGAASMGPVPSMVYKQFL